MSNAKKFVNKLHGRRVLIIGGTSGLGFAAAEASVEYGVSQIILSSSQESRVNHAIAKLKASYPHSQTEIIGYTCDLANESSLENNIKDLFSKVGTIDHIVFTAGDAPSLEPFVNTDFDTMKQIGMVRFFGPLLVARYGHTHLSPGPASSITLTTGVSGTKPIPGWTTTASYLSGLHGMTRSLALDLKPVRVNLVNPGAVNTEMWDILEPEVREHLIEELRKVTTTGRVGTVEDIAEAYLYCMRDQNLTGSVIHTNGGRLLL
ncbi:hypothetical protein PISL3812_06079 [Talaromyces islandicus]|uniref:Uncharacterized protein n=1 Tax=Talaromyces islandicus TaxID=28573 RepID=A0A0U1M0E9_TALIS|nr:hypothetical protein PISL3812_06079 [Talaromyces islandicus]